MPKKKASKGLKAVNEAAGGSAGNPDIRYTNTFCIDDVYSWDYENELGNETFRKSFEDIFVGKVPEDLIPNTAPFNGTIEFSMNQFESWYERFSFQSFLLEQSRKSRNVKRYILKVIYFFPDSNKEMSEWPQHQKDIMAQLYNFYRTTLMLSAGPNLTSMALCVQKFPSILILAIRTDNVGEARTLSKPSKKILKRIEVVGAITYIRSTFKSGVLLEDPSAMILFFATGKSSTTQDVDGNRKNMWSKKGFGLFLLTLLAKPFALQTQRCDNGLLPPFKMFLQCKPNLLEEVVNYFIRWGFVPMNDHTQNNGRELIPDSLSIQLCDYCFIEHSESPMILLCLESRNGHPIPPTFINKPGSLSKHPLESVHVPLPASLEGDSSSDDGKSLLKNEPFQPSSDSDDEPFATLVPEPTLQVVENLEHIEETDDSDTIYYSDDNDDQVSVFLTKSSKAASIEVIEVNRHGKEVKKSINFKDKCWARFPPSSKSGIVMSNEDLRHAQRDLPFLNELFPLSTEHSLMESSAHAFHGEILMQQRLQESISEGTSWMKTGHIASALALLMCDGRYKDHAAIIPPTYMVAISSAYECLLDLRKAMRERRRVWVTEEDIAWKKTRYDNHVNFLIKNVIMSHDNLFKKRLIVFVLNESSVHWTATFVFNPSCIKEDANPNSRQDLRCCFYRYCGKSKSGDTYVDRSHGMHWFLNLLYNFDIRSQKMVELAKNNTDTTDVEIGDDIPFGENSADSMQGSPTFPSLKIDTGSFLPQQVDDHNCGMALIAATGIILRDLFGQPDFTSKFNSLFAVLNLEVLQEERSWKSKKYVEWYCVLPMNTFREVADQTSGTYLQLLKVDFYVLFDRFAELEYESLPRSVDKNAKIDGA